jgi:hypothetical protein
MPFRWSTRFAPGSGSEFLASQPQPHGTTTVPATSSSSDFGRAAMAILATMVLLIVALTGILVETTWGNPQASIETLPTDPGSFAQR